MWSQRKSHEEIFFYVALALTSLKPACAALTISGTVTDLDGSPIGSVLISLSVGASSVTATDASGAYSFTGLHADNYAISASKSGLVFTPAVISTNGVSADLPGQNFTYGKRWTGAGSNTLASNPNNWTGNSAPQPNDTVRFDVTNSTKTCFWDIGIATRISSFELKTGFSSSVVVGCDVKLGTVTVEAGELLMSTFEVNVGSDVTQTGGRIRAGPGGSIIFYGNSVQKVLLVKTSLGSGLYDNYFSNFRVAGSSTVRAISDLIVDETFNISSGRFESMSGTHTFTGGTQSGLGGSFNWDSSNGSFSAGTGSILFDSRVGGSYQVKPGAANLFNNLSNANNSAISFSSQTTINGNLNVSGTGATVSLADGSVTNILGLAQIGPASTSGSATLTVGSSTANFQGGVIIGTAVASVQGGLFNVKASSVVITSQGTLQIPTGQTGRFTFWDGTNLSLNAGTLLIQGSSVFTSSAPSVARYSADLNGTINIQASSVFSSLNSNGLRMGLGSNPVNLKAMDFRNGITGGVALNFSPVTVASVTVDSPSFDSSISTNIAAVLNPAIVANSDIDVILSTGAHTGPTYENDPSGIVNWGRVGVATNFSGTSLGVSSINWSWTKAANPLGFIVFSSTNGAVSPTLDANTTYWIETNLSTNTAYTRYVQEFNDAQTVNSANATRYTDAVPAINGLFTDIAISSLTFTWGLNGNPSATTFLIERSTNDIAYTQISSGPYSSLAPYTDTGLISEKRYYYRIKTQNGDGVLVSGNIKISTFTISVPPPFINSIVPSTVTNLGVKSFTVDGAQFQTGAVIRLKRSSAQIIRSISSTVVDGHTMTATFNLTGALAALWDVEIENPDGRISLGTGTSLLNVTDATSAGAVTVQDYSSGSSLTITTAGGGTTVSLPAGAMSSGRIYVSIDPVNTPLVITAAQISAANADITGLTLIPDSIREFAAFTTQGQFSSAFSGSVSIGIAYPDANSDGVIDSASLRVSSLQLMTLNETTGLWQLVSGATIDTVNKRVTATVNHFSVYALFASAATSSLSAVKVYPSPWKPGSSTNFDADSVTISNLTDEGRIRIYTLDARLIREIFYTTADGGTIAWDGKDKDSERVKSGVYLLNIQSSVGETKTIKLGIER